MNRRTFIQSAVATGAASAAFSRVQFARAQGEAKFSIALIGSGWWGMNILREAIAAQRGPVVALCDADTNLLSTNAAEVEKLSGNKPRTYKDYREMLATEKPGIVIVATPDHWHALNAIAALKAGAHVYLEKPICHTINEGKAIVKAARQSGRAVQIGTHRRASPHNISAQQFLREGKAGEIGLVRSFVHYGGGPGQKQQPVEPPANLDWNLYCGPAQLMPYYQGIHQRGWRNYLNFSNGQLGDWGIHWLDQILWWSKEAHGEVAPQRVFSTMSRQIRTDHTDIPDTQIATYEFKNFTASWEHRLYADNKAEKHNIGCYFYGTRGTLHLGWLDGWTFYPSNGRDPIIHEDAKLNKPDEQNIKELWADFLKAIDSGSKPISNIESGHRSTTMALLGMLSGKIGRSVNWDGQKEVVIGDKEANRLLSRPYRAPWKYPEG
jgi:predicted dehydrogenase